ncbi:MAG: hypothetical protein DAHOPDDO_02414 [Ignavibacteriaceae bacterium]|nr:hypothetical protein [Ignavibacteriaceae bacterium]
MKKWAAILFVCLFTNNFSQTNVSPQFSELKGIEDQLGNTHLFYRIYEKFSNQYVLSIDNSIYHFDLTTSSDSLFLEDYSHSDPVMSYFRTVNDYTFWDDDFSKYIFCGSMGSWEPGPYIRRFDSDYIMLNYLCCEVNQIDISRFNDSLLYAGGYLYSENQSNSIRSHDGGFTWETVNDTLVFLSLNPLDDNLMFFENLNGDIYRSIDGANSFHLVDVMSESGFSDSFLYDSDDLHIYRIYSEKTLKASSNKGEAFSWQTKYSSDSEIFISIDESISGTIYLADKRNIFLSTDYGNTFNIYKTLDRKIVGIYKKSNSNKLYAATKYKIYEITPDTVQVIKSLPAIDDLQWYPFSIGNKWVFENYRQEFNPPGIKEFIGLSIMEIAGDTSINGKIYYKLMNEPLYWNIDVGLIRQDSLNAKLFIYLPEENEEVLYEDFLAQVGDTIWVDSIEYKILQNEEPFSVWGINTYKRTIDYQFRFQEYELVKDIGLYELGFSDFFARYTMELKGCIIDGVVHGDTITVGVDNDETQIVSEFKLEQNYPNPFNPNTVISYQLPVTSNVTLKVYDILGNEIATLVNEEKQPRTYEVEFNVGTSRNLSLTSGIYFYQLKAGSFIQTKKMVYLK